MAYALRFEKLKEYDSGEAGISVSVSIKLNSKKVSFNAKIDTGATFCIFEREVGEQLGIEIDSGLPKIISTATGTFRVFGHDVTLSTFGFEFDSQVFFAHHEGFRNNVLGRHGWLNRVEIAINDYEGKLYLSNYEPS